jgi:hypothetical protein
MQQRVNVDIQRTVPSTLRYRPRRQLIFTEYNPFISSAVANLGKLMGKAYCVKRTYYSTMAHLLDLDRNLSKPLQSANNNRVGI